MFSNSYRRISNEILQAKHIKFKVGWITLNQRDQKDFPMEKFE